MKLIFVVTFLSLSVFAETYEYKVDGMSCSGCKAMIKSAICVLPGIKDCTVEIGSMKLTPEDGKELDQDAINKALTALNEKNKENYKLSSPKKIANVSTKTVDKK